MAMALQIGGKWSMQDLSMERALRQSLAFSSALLPGYVSLSRSSSEVLECVVEWEICQRGAAKLRFF